MTVSDTSFLFSLYGSDAHTDEAQAWARQSKQPIAITALNRYEFANAIRFLAFRNVISHRDARNSLEAFDADVKHGILQMTPCELTAVVNEAERLSERHTLDAGHRSFDILHIATARILKATTFLTFDLNQRKLASAVRLPVGP